MADVDGVLEVERVGQCGDVGGVGVHLVAGGGLRRAAVAAAIMRDDPVAVVQEEQHLVVPVVGAERPAVVEDDRLRVLRTPVLVEDLGAVLGGDEAHGLPSFAGSSGGFRVNRPRGSAGRSFVVALAASRSRDLAPRELKGMQDRGHGCESSLRRNG